MEVLFSGQHQLTINGYLHAVGTVTDSIVFRGLDRDNPGNWLGLNIGYNYTMPGPDVTLSYFRIDGGGHYVQWPSAGLAIKDRSGNINVSHGLLTNNGWDGVRISSMDGTSMDSAYVNLSDIKVHGSGYDAFEIDNNYYTVINIDNVQVKDGVWDGFRINYNNYSDIDLTSVRVKKLW